MDPLTVTITAVGLTARCFSTVQDIRNKVAQYQRLPRMVSALVTDIGLMNELLDALQKTLSRRSEVHEGYTMPQVFFEVINTCKEGCEEVERIFEDGFANFSQSAAGSRERLELLWKEDDLKHLQDTMERSKARLNLLMNSMQISMGLDVGRSMPSTVSVPTGTVPVARFTIQNPVALIDPEPSLFSAQSVQDLTFSDEEDEKRSVDHSFLHDLFTSRPYQKALIPRPGRASNRSEHSDITARMGTPASATVHEIETPHIHVANIYQGSGSSPTQQGGIRGDHQPSENPSPSCRAQEISSVARGPTLRRSHTYGDLRQHSRHQAEQVDVQADRPPPRREPGRLSSRPLPLGESDGNRRPERAEPHARSSAPNACSTSRKPERAEVEERTYKLRRVGRSMVELTDMTYQPNKPYLIDLDLPVFRDRADHSRLMEKAMTTSRADLRDTRSTAHRASKTREPGLPTDAKERIERYRSEYSTVDQKTSEGSIRSVRRRTGVRAGTERQHTSVVDAARLRKGPTNKPTAETAGYSSVLEDALGMEAGNQIGRQTTIRVHVESSVTRLGEKNTPVNTARKSKKQRDSVLSLTSAQSLEVKNL